MDNNLIPKIIHLNLMLKEIFQYIWCNINLIKTLCIFNIKLCSLNYHKEIIFNQDF